MGCKASAPVNQQVPTWAEVTSTQRKMYSKYDAGEAKAEEGGEGPFSTTDRTREATIKFSEVGAGSRSETPATTIPAVFKACVDKCGAAPAMRKENVPETLGKGETPPACPPVDEWQTRTWNQYYAECMDAAQAFISFGLERFDAVTIYGFNSPEWIMAEMACILAGGISAGIYPTDTPDQVRYKALHSGAVVAVVENGAKLQMFKELAPGLPKLRAVVVWSPEKGLDLGNFEADGRSITVCKWSDLKGIAAEAKGTVDTVDARIAAQKPGHCCAYIYTSGTTGEPKAVMITHDNIIFESTSATHLINNMGTGPDQDRIISYLPLSHVAGMMVDIVCPIMVGANMASSVCVYFARPYDLRAGTIGDRLRGVRPTVFLGVPRVWEKIQEKMMATVAANPPKGAKLKVARWSKKRGLEHQINMQLGGSGAYGCCYNFADKKVLSVVKARLGLDACKFGFTGAAPIKTETLEYFGALGIQINEVYGMSECTGATTWSTDEAHKWGSCGFPMPSAEVKILQPTTDGSFKECPRWTPGTPVTDAVQGEVCYRGRHIMMGYMANPDLGPEHVAKIKAKNAEAIDADGWLHSGDKGLMDADCMVKITGRYKELIIGAGGENIAPVPIEDAVKQRCPAISNIMMVGDKRKFNVALVTLKTVGATGELPGSDKLDGPAAALVDGVTTIGEAVKSKAYLAAIEKAIVDTNNDPKAVPSNAAKIGKFTILRADFSVQTDELTPTLKLKRSVAEGKHSSFIDTMYAPANAKATFVPYEGTSSEEVAVGGVGHK